MGKVDLRKFSYDDSNFTKFKKKKNSKENNNEYKKIDRKRRLNYGE